MNRGGFVFRFHLVIRSVDPNSLRKALWFWDSTNESLGVLLPGEFKRPLTRRQNFFRLAVMQ